MSKPATRVELTSEQTSQLRFLQAHIDPEPSLDAMVEAAVARWVADQWDEVGIPDHQWRATSTPRIMR